MINNANFIKEEINWVKNVINRRIELQQTPPEEQVDHPLNEFPPQYEDYEGSTFASKILSLKQKYAHKIPSDEPRREDIIYKYLLFDRLTLSLALTPHLAPQILDKFFTKNRSYNRSFTEYGGLLDKKHMGFLPTLETVYFLIAGNSLELRLELERFFIETSLLFSEDILVKGDFRSTEPLGTMPLIVSPRFFNKYVLSISDYIPTFNHQFPAELYTTKLEWEDLILPQATLNAIEEIKDWITYRKDIFQQEKAQKMLQPGFRVLFYGLPGTGKSLTAGLIGKATNKLVFRIDLSKVISKYIGETEKNLASVFDQAQHNDWILFFDEADALFGKRVKTNDAKDRYANQETAYLLQRIETFPGVAILASNQIENLDRAFARRFQAVIRFPMPGLQERIRLWRNTFERLNFDAPYNTVDKQLKLWTEFAESHQLTGASIQNTLRKSLLLAQKNNGGLLLRKHIEEALERELEKERRM